MALQDLALKMLGKLHDSGLDQADVTRLLFRTLTPEQADAEGKHLRAGGFLIPYFDMDAKPTEFWRFRFLEKPAMNGFLAATDKKQPKYIQAAGTLNEVYLPPYVDWRAIALDPTQPVMITEGELKAACCTKIGPPCIGLGGVACWRSTRAGLGLLPQLEQFAWTDRLVCVVFDSDAISNPLVCGEENKLCEKLLSLGAKPRIIRLPAEGEHKVGLDDFLVARGTQALVDLIKASEDYSASKALHALNAEVVYVRNPSMVLEVGGQSQRMKCNVFADEVYATRRHTVTKITAKGPKLEEVKTAREWLFWQGRAEVGGLVYAPGAPRIVDNRYNIWDGWGCVPLPGSVEPWHKLLDHVLHGMSKEHRRWFEQWLAYPLQHPGTKLYQAVLIWGLVHGSGKSLLGYTMGQLYGSNFLEVNEQVMSGSFTAWMEGRQFIMGDEVTGGDKRSTADRMKGLITQKQVWINKKHQPEYTVADCCNYYLTSQHADSLYVEDHDRRYFIHEVPAHIGVLPPEFYAEYERWYTGAGAAHLFDYLLHVDTRDFNPKGHAPTTNAKLEMREVGRSELGAWVAGLRECPDNYLRQGNLISPRCLWSSEDLHQLFDPEHRGKVTPNGMSRALKQAGFKQVANGTPIIAEDGRRVRVWAIRDAEKYTAMGPAEVGRAYADELGMRKKVKF
jgi:hypothetical protein